MFLLQLFLDTLIVILSSSIVVLGENLLDTTLHNMRDIFMELVVLGQHVDLAGKLLPAILPLYVLLHIIHKYHLLVHNIILQLRTRRRLLDLEYNVDG